MPFSLFRASDDSARLQLLRALNAVHLGAHVTGTSTASAVCVAAVLGDRFCRLVVFGGRAEMPRSLGSVLASFVVRFLGGILGVEDRIIQTPLVKSCCSVFTLSRDGSTLLVADCCGGSHSVHLFNVRDGAYIRRIGSSGVGPLQFWNPRQLWIASDDFVFVADFRNGRIQVLTPRFDFHGFLGEARLAGPAGVCGDDTSVFVSEMYESRISVFNRSDGALLRRFGSRGCGDGQLWYPRGLCITGESHYIAVADYSNNRVCVFTIDGVFSHHVGASELRAPTSVTAAATGGELVVADSANNRVVVFDASGGLLHTFGHGCFTGVAIHGTTVFAQTFSRGKCVVFK